MLDNIITEFPVALYGNLEKYNETISKGRCRIFYKYGNRNGTYITDEFADKLLSSIAYAPVKGIYDGDDEDYTDHGEKRTEGRIYGVVPENPNVSWEPHVDDDGVERLYACVDVLVFTGLYKEAKEIVGKGQSMELYPKSLKGDWKIIEGKRYFVFEEGCFLGLQILGDDVEPCFEGAAFFTLYENLKKVVDQMEKYNLKKDSGGKKVINYKLSDDQKFSALWSLLNVNYSEENNWVVEYDICAVYDDYAVVKNYAEGIWERVFYKKDDETDSIEITNRERCYIMDVSEAEKTALETLHKMNNSTYENVDATYSLAVNSLNQVTEELTKMTESNAELNNTITALQEKNSNFEMKIGEQDEKITTLTTERDNIALERDERDVTISSLRKENENLASFKTDVENKEKQAIIDKYSAKLGNEILATYTTEKLAEYSAIQLEKELAYALVSSDPTVFSAAQGEFYIPNNNNHLSGLEGILSKYDKK